MFWHRLIVSLPRRGGIAKLTTALSTAVEKGDGTIDKEATSHDDLLDAFRLSLRSLFA